MTDRSVHSQKSNSIIKLFLRNIQIGETGGCQHFRHCACTNHVHSELRSESPSPLFDNFRTFRVPGV